MTNNKQRERLVELLKKKYDHFCDQCGVNKDSHYTDMSKLKQIIRNELSGLRADIASEFKNIAKEL